MNAPFVFLKPVACTTCETGLEVGLHPLVHASHRQNLCLLGDQRGFTKATFAEVANGFSRRKFLLQFASIIDGHWDLLHLLKVAAHTVNDDWILWWIMGRR